MMTVKEVSKLAGVSIRALQYYDKIGLLHPAKHTEAGYRLYDDAALERLQQIMLFRELEFSLKEIQNILDNPEFDRDFALEQQIKMLTLKRDHLDGLISFAREQKELGGKPMSFDAFNNKKLEEYAKEAKEKWADTMAYSEYQEKSKARSKETEAMLGQGLMDIFAEFGKAKHLPNESPEVQALVEKLQSYISNHYYLCTKDILSSLGQMYRSGGAFTDNIDAVGGNGTAEFAASAISAFCK